MSPRVCSTSVGQATLRKVGRGVDVAEARDDPRRLLRRAGHALQLVERTGLLGRRVGKQQVGEQLQVGGVVLSPPELDHLDLRLDGGAPLGGRVAAQRAARERPQQHQVADALGVPNGVGDRDRAPLRRAEQRELVELGGVDDRLEIADEHVERGVGRVVIRQAAPARVVAIETKARADRVEPGAPHRRLPVDVDVGEPVRRAHQRGTLAVRRERQPRPVRRPREAQILDETPVRAGRQHDRARIGPQRIFREAGRRVTNGVARPDMSSSERVAVIKLFSKGVTVERDWLFQARTGTSRNGLSASGSPRFSSISSGSILGQDTGRLW